MSKIPIIEISEPDFVPVEVCVNDTYRKVLHLRPFSLRDEAWMREIFEDNENIFTDIEKNKDMTRIMQVFVHQLVDDDRVDLANELNTTPETLADKLMSVLTIEAHDSTGYGSCAAIIYALGNAYKVSWPEIPEWKHVKKNLRRRGVRWSFIFCATAGVAIVLCTTYLIILRDVFCLFMKSC